MSTNGSTTFRVRHEWVCSVPQVRHARLIFWLAMSVTCLRHGSLHREYWRHDTAFLGNVHIEDSYLPTSSVDHMDGTSRRLSSLDAHLKNFGVQGYGTLLRQGRSPLYGAASVAKRAEVKQRGQEVDYCASTRGNRERTRQLMHSQADLPRERATLTPLQTCRGVQPEAALRSFVQRARRGARRRCDNQVLIRRIRSWTRCLQRLSRPGRSRPRPRTLAR